MSLAGQLNSVLDRTQRLIELCEALQEENDLLKLENQSLQVAVETGKSKAVEMEEKMKVLKLARSLEGITVKKISPDEKTLDIKQKISEFVREIDKCIVLLKK
jgi:regulator of replication initiation timing